VLGPFSLSYAKAINKRYNRVGPLFQGRFQAKRIAQDEYLLHLSRYIHLNPVMAGLSRAPEDWEFSSYRDYIGLRKGTLPQTDMVLGLLGSTGTPGAAERAAYRQFVEAYRERDTAMLRELVFEDQ